MEDSFKSSMAAKASGGATGADKSHSGVISLAISVVVLGVLWSDIIGKDGIPSGDGLRVFRFLEFVRGAAHGLVFWNPFRNGGFPLFAEPQHYWLLSLFVDPASRYAYLEYNLALFATAVAVAIPVWLICRKLNFSPLLTIVLVVTVGYNEWMIWTVQSGRFEILVCFSVLLIIVWVLLFERLRPWHYALLVVCVAIAIEALVQTALPYCIILYTGLALRHECTPRPVWRRVFNATASTIAVLLAGLCLSAVWSVPLVAWFSGSHTPASALTYYPMMPENIRDYGRIIVPFVPADGEFVSFTSLLLAPAAVLLGLGRPSGAIRRVVMIGIPIYLWTLMYIAMSLPIVGEHLANLYSVFPPIASNRWFAPFEMFSMVLLAIGAVGVFQSCEACRIREVGWKSRILLGGYFALCAVFAVSHGLKYEEPLAGLAGALLAALALYCLVSATGRVLIAPVEPSKIRSLVVVLVAVTVVAERAADYHWGLQWPFVQTGPELPKLDNIIRNNSQAYFRYLQVSGSNWWLEQRKRSVWAFGNFFPKALSYSLIYLNPRQNLGEPRPHWLKMPDCNEFDPAALDLLGVKYVICRHASSPSANWAVIAAEQGQALFRRSDYDGGIRLYCRWRVVGDETPLRARDGVLQAFRDRVALVSADDATGMPAPDPDCPSTDQPIGMINLLKDQPGRMVLDVTAEKAGIVVIPDNYAPGWRAWINGSEANVLKVYQAYLGVRVGAGRNMITLVFRDDYFWPGLAISVMTAIGLAAYLAVFGSRSQNSARLNGKISQ